MPVWSPKSLSPTRPSLSQSILEFAYHSTVSIISHTPCRMTISNHPVYVHAHIQVTPAITSSDNTSLPVDLYNLTNKSLRHSAKFIDGFREFFFRVRVSLVTVFQQGSPRLQSWEELPLSSCQIPVSLLQLNQSSGRYVAAERGCSQSTWGLRWLPAKP